MVLPTKECRSGGNSSEPWTRQQLRTLIVLAFLPSAIITIDMRTLSRKLQMDNELALCAVDTVEEDDRNMPCYHVDRFTKQEESVFVSSSCNSYHEMSWYARNKKDKGPVQSRSRLKFQYPQEELQERCCPDPPTNSMGFATKHQEPLAIENIFPCFFRYISELLDERSNHAVGKYHRGREDYVERKTEYLELIHTHVPALGLRWILFVSVMSFQPYAHRHLKYKAQLWGSPTAVLWCFSVKEFVKVTFFKGRPSMKRIFLSLHGRMVVASFFFRVVSACIDIHNDISDYSFLYFDAEHSSFNMTCSFTWTNSSKCLVFLKNEIFGRKWPSH